MAVTFIAVAGIAFAISVLLPPVYESKARLLIESQHIPSNLIQSTVQTNARERIALVEQRITTREVLLGIAEKFRLYPEDRDTLTPSGIIQKMRDSITIENAKVGVGRSATTIGFDVSFQDRDPSTTARVTNELVTQILSADVKSRTSRAAETTRFIDREAEARKNELVKLDAQIANFKLENNSMLPRNVGVQRSRLQQAKTTLNSIDRELQNMQQQKRLMELELSVRRTGTSNLGAAATPNYLERLKAELAQKKIVYKENHPDVRILQRQIEVLEDELASQPKDEVKTRDEPLEQGVTLANLPERILKERIRGLEDREQVLNKQKAELPKTAEQIAELIAKSPEIAVKLDDFLQRRAVIASALNQLTGKLTQAKLGERLEQDQQAESFQVLEQPITPTTPVKPNRPVILAGGIGAAGGLSFAIMVLLELLNRSVRSAKDITQALNQSPLGVIPYFVTRQERLHLRRRLAWSFSFFVLFIVMGLITIHIFYQPLDQIYYKILTRFGL